MQYWEVIADKLSAAGAPFALLVFVVASAFAKSPAPEVIFISPCESQGFHGKNRWIVKTDFTPVPSDKSAIQSVTPSQIYAWEGLGADVDLTRYSEARLPSEEKWYALTGRVVDATVVRFDAAPCAFDELPFFIGNLRLRGWLPRLDSNQE